MRKISFQESLDKIIQDRNKLIPAIIAILIILCLDFFFVLKLQMRALGRISPKITKLGKNLENLNSDSIRMQRQKTDVATGRLKKIMLSGQMPWVIEEISRLANQQEVEISQIRPVRKPPASEISQDSSQPEKYSPIFIELKIFAGYHQLGRFLAELENHPIFLGIEELDINQSDKGPLVHKIKLKLKIYVSEG